MTSTFYIGDLLIFTTCFKFFSMDTLILDFRVGVIRGLSALGFTFIHIASISFFKLVTAKGNLREK